MGGAYSIYIGVSILSREEQYKTSEFLLSRPIGRGEVLSSKIAVMKTYIFLLNLVMWINGIIWTGFIGGFGNTFTQVTILHIYGLFICLFFGFLGLLISIIMKRARAVIGAAVGIVMGFYMLDMILRITDKAQFLLYFTPFKYVDINILDSGYQLEAWRIGVMAACILVMAGFSFLLYRRKDILI
jgi:ABC-2 type transport system permease protein